MLTDKQIRDYFEQGYLLVENVITDAQLKTLQNITYDFIEASKNVTESNDIYDLDVGHTAENPKLTRIKLPHKQHAFFTEILRNSGVTEVLRDLPWGSCNSAYIQAQHQSARGWCRGGVAPRLGILSSYK